MLLLSTPGLSPAADDKASLEQEARFLEELIDRERDALIQSLQTLVDLSPYGKFTDRFLIRLAELKYENAVIGFEARLARYEEDYAKYEKGENKDEPEYPVYDFSGVLNIYKRILRDYPKSELADDVLYLTGLCYKKMDEQEKANKAFEVLTSQYPSSDYYVDALMEIGGYCFNNPDLYQGKGYEKAIEIYKQILRRRESDKFIEALYRLAWSYYMIDRYEDAITVFRHLIEEIDISENYASDEARKAQNPLFKSEAIEYIAVSLCEVNDLANAKRFLDMIGNNRYSLMVLNRMGLYYEEQLEYERALDCYALVTKKYPDLDKVLDGRMGHIRCLERLEQFDRARDEKEEFFRIYARGGKWQGRITDPGARAKADSLSILCILSVAQAHITEARKSNLPADYLLAVKSYASLIEVYPDDPGSYEALWNSALIYEQNLRKYEDARRTYLLVSARKGGKHRQQAAINAIAMAQQLDEDNAPDKEGLTSRDRKIIEACRNFAMLFPESPEVVEVASNAAAIFFNRKLFAKSLSAYEKIYARCKGSVEPLCLDALFYIAQSHSGLNDYLKAEENYARLFALAPMGSQRDEARKRMVEAAFQYADGKRQKQDYAAAAELFLAIEKKYPFYADMDIVLFNAADAYEKMKQWKDGAAVYRRTADQYPGSKLADGALFNGALCYENDSAYKDAIGNYELLLDKYPASPKARDALYNIGLNYEKLKDYDRMAEVNERYAEKYPDSKDVEQMLFSSGRFFYQAGKLDRAQRAFENFVRRFPGSGNEIEARYNIAQILWKNGDKVNAETAFQDLIKRNGVLAEIGKSNDYFAAEALYRLAGMTREKYMAVRFTLPDKVMERQQQEKTELLKRTVDEYTRVIALKSEHIFEAAYRIGEAYTHFADIFTSQERDPKLDDTKRLLLEKDLLTMAVGLNEKCIEPHMVNINLARNFNRDSLKAEQIQYVELSRAAVNRTLLSLGGYVERVAWLFLNAKVPDKLARLPVQSYLYRQKMLETVLPFLDQAFDKYVATAKSAAEKGLTDSLVTAIRDSASKVLYERGALFENLANEMLNNPALPEKMSSADKEEIVFQLEDMAFEIQDKALEKYEEGHNYLKGEGISNAYSLKILERLKIMDPQTYTPKEVLKEVSLYSGPLWKTSAAHLPGWYKLEKTDSGWTDAELSGKAPPSFWPEKESRVMTAGAAEKEWYVKRLFYLPGRPSRAMARVLARGTYKLFINGVFIAGDSGKVRDENSADTMDLKSYLSGGDNAVAVLVKNEAGGCALLFALHAVMDTSLKSPSNFGLMPLGAEGLATEAPPPPAATTMSSPSTPASTTAEPAQARTDSAAPAPVPAVVPAAPAPVPEAVVPKPVPDKKASFEKEFKNFGEFKKAIDQAVAREQAVQKEIKETQTRIRGLKFKLDSMNGKISAVEIDIRIYRKKLESKERTK